MRAVYKYPFSIRGGEQLVAVHGGESASPVHVGLDPTGAPNIWMEVNPSDPIKTVDLHVFGTGHEIDDPNLRHMGSFLHQSTFMWHVYSRRIGMSA